MLSVSLCRTVRCVTGCKLINIGCRVVIEERENHQHKKTDTNIHTQIYIWQGSFNVFLLNQLKKLGKPRVVAETVNSMCHTVELNLEESAWEENHLPHDHAFAYLCKHIRIYTLENEQENGTSYKVVTKMYIISMTRSDKTRTFEKMEILDSRYKVLS